MPAFHLLESSARAQRAGTSRFAVTFQARIGKRSYFDYVYIRDPKDIERILAHPTSLTQRQLQALYQRARRDR